MPRLQLARLIPALLLLAAVFVAFRRSSFEIFFKNDAYDLTTSHSDDFDDSDLEGRIEGQFVRRIVAVGDLHGDYANSLKVLQMSNVVDAHGNWTGEVDIFVQTGDIIDRGDDTIKLFTWMEKLRVQALSVGGRVVSHMGNHEWMNLLGDWRYVHPSEIRTFGSVAARQKMLQKGRIGKAWQQNYTITSRVPLHPFMGPIDLDYDPSADNNSPLSRAALAFVHGGLAPTYEHLMPYPSRINALGARLLDRLMEREFPPPHPPHPYSGLPDDATPEEKSLYGADGPLWYRGWAMDEEKDVCNKVDYVLQRTGVRRLIMGHTPNFHKIVSRCSGKIIIIDTGISHAYGGELSALTIKYTLSPHKEDKRLWTEREIVTAIYPTRQEVLVIQQGEVIGEF